VNHGLIATFFKNTKFQTARGKFELLFYFVGEVNQADMQRGEINFSHSLSRGIREYETPRNPTAPRE
jgi:hypothetical protein